MRIHRQIFGLAVLLTCSFSNALAQSYSITPASLEISDTVPVDGSATLQFDIANLVDSNLLLSWELIELDFPIGWDYNLCDYQQCLLPPLPAYRDMEPIPPLATNGVYLKLWVSPEDIAGYGIMRLYAYETLNPSVGDTVTYHITASGFMDIADHDIHRVATFPNPATNTLNIDLSAMEINSVNSLSLINLQGKEVLSLDIQNEDYIDLDLSELSKGSYLIQFNGNSTSFSKRIIINH